MKSRVGKRKHLGSSSDHGDSFDLPGVRWSRRYHIWLFVNEPYDAVGRATKHFVKTNTEPALDRLASAGLECLTVLLGIEATRRMVDRYRFLTFLERVNNGRRSQGLESRISGHRTVGAKNRTWYALPVHRHPDSCTDNGCEGFQGDCTHNKCIGYASCGTLSQPH